MATNSLGDIRTFMTRVVPTFAATSWAAWRAIVAAIFALVLSPDELATFRALTGRQTPPTSQASEAWLIIRRRSGKSQIAALLAVFLATCRTYALSPGERGLVMVIAADRRQARVVFGYILGLLESTPILAQLIAHRTKESIELTNGLTIEIHTSSFRAVRGYTVVAAICDEIAFWPKDDSANPDREVLSALRPAMATIPDALLIALSSPYDRRGELYRMHAKHYGKDDSPVLVVQCGTDRLNPTMSQAVVDAAYEDDPVAAGAEWGAQFRTDVESFVSPDVLADCTMPGRHELPPLPALECVAFVDPAGGSGADSMTIAIGHAATRNGHAIVVLDALREVKPKFSPESVVADFAALLKTYRITTVTGDRYAGEWPREAFKRHGIDYELADKSKSELYRDLLPMLNSGHVELLDHPRLLAQLQGLERRTARGGRDSIDHAPGGHDDVANVVAGVASIVALRDVQTEATWGRGESPVAADGPEVYVGRYRIRESDVRHALTQSGDIHLYDAGRLSKATAYRMTQVGLLEQESTGLWCPPSMDRW